MRLHEETETPLLFLDCLSKQQTIPLLLQYYNIERKLQPCSLDCCLDCKKLKRRIVDQFIDPNQDGTRTMVEPKVKNKDGDARVRSQGVQIPTTKPKRRNLTVHAIT